MWLTALQRELGGEVSDEKMRDYIWNTLKSGRVRTAKALVTRFHSGVWHSTGLTLPYYNDIL